MAAQLAAAQAPGVIPATPQARSGHTHVYSRAAGQLFLLGGKSLATGEALREVWQQEVPAGRWRQVSLVDHALGEVLAATYSFSDDGLWVLDRSGPKKHMRLSIINPASGKVTVVGEWPKIGAFDRHWLLLDQDGSILLVASSSVLGQHVIVKLTRSTQGVFLGGFHTGEHALISSPVVDEAGYWFPVEQKKQPGVRLLRLAALSPKAASWASFGGCF
jgi:hypothetical protein